MPPSQRTPGPRGHVQILHPAGGGEESVGRVLARDAAFDRPSARRDGFLSERKPLARGDAQLPLHEIDARHELGDRVLDLDARVHLEEVERSLRVEQELARAGVDIARGTRRRDRGLAHARGAAPAITATLGASSIIFWWRRWTEHSRSPSVSMVPCMSPEHLDLDVARADDVLLDVHRVVAERVLRFALGRRRAPPRAPRGSRTTRMPFPPPPAAAFSSTG